MADIQLYYGLRDGVPVPICAITAELNGDRCRCVCPECGKTLQARTLGKKRAAYFAHKSASNCQPETIQHKTAKFLLQWRINSAITDRKPLQIAWQCESCRGHFSADITKNVVNAQIEKWIAPIRPDVVTLDNEGNPVALIEVVFESHPSDDKIQFARDHQLDLYEFHIKVDSTKVLMALETAAILSPSRVRPCRDERCSTNHVRSEKKALRSNPLLFAATQTDDVGMNPAHVVDAVLNEKDKPEVQIERSALVWWLLMMVGLLAVIFEVFSRKPRYRSIRQRRRWRKGEKYRAS